ncbi:hypothetical protein CJU90_3080 [Yarrowia sp. C11]|nr:hypothetical protein CKK34_4529 [Yarrowia sp. E02]KAG5369608.1 hypothetical protein CJU90_3080 [Yarrowia sp. C11]
MSSIHYDTVTSGVTKITQPTIAFMHPLRTVYDYYSQPREESVSSNNTIESADALSFTSSSYASISTISSCDITPRDAKLKHSTRFKQWTKRVKEKVRVKFNPPVHPSTTLSCVHSLVESMDVPLTDSTTGELTHWPVLLKLVDHVTHNFPFTQNQLWCIQRTVSQLDSLVFGSDTTETTELNVEETEIRILSLIYKYKTVFCLNYVREMNI